MDKALNDLNNLCKQSRILMLSRKSNNLIIHNVIIKLPMHYGWFFLGKAYFKVCIQGKKFGCHFKYPFLLHIKQYIHTYAHMYLMQPY